VVYLRAISAPMRVSAGLPANDLFPLLSFRQIEPNLHFIKIEILREAATMVMLATVASAMAKNLRTWLAAFAIAFGVWDLSFYASLKALIGWPESLLTWDLLFLLPVPWTGPVLSPVIVAASLTVGGIFALLREPTRVAWISWSMLLVGGTIILAAFTWDWRYILYGGVPRHFPWTLFATGEMVGVVTLAFALSSRRRDQGQAAANPL
jgi:hypothetical protein